MANDDLVPDEALVVRLEQAAQALSAVAEMAAVRPHLPKAELEALALRAHELVGETNAAAHPDDDINAKYRSRMRGEFLTTSCGIKFFPFDPKPTEVTHLDIVIGLVNEVRYNGQTSKPEAPHIPRPVSIAEHSIKAAAIAELLCERDELSHELRQLAALHTMLHDAHEALLGDTIRPMKARMYDVLTGQPLSAIEQSVQDVILEAYGLGPMPAEVDSIVREADLLAYTCEVMSIRRQPLDEDNRPLPVVEPHILDAGRIKPEAPQRDMVRQLFDSEVQRLVTLCGGVIPGPQRPPQVAEGTVDPTHALETLARLKQVPGDKPYESLGPEVRDTGYMPSSIQRAPRAGDVSQSSWQEAMKGLATPTPQQLIDEIKAEMADPETPELKRKVLQEELDRLSSVGGGE